MIASGMISRISYPAYHAACDLAYPVPVLLKKLEVCNKPSADKFGAGCVYYSTPKIDLPSGVRWIVGCT